jgi:hypothetical protein
MEFPLVVSIINFLSQDCSPTNDVQASDSFKKLLWYTTYLVDHIHWLRTWQPPKDICIKHRQKEWQNNYNYWKK